MREIKFSSQKNESAKGEIKYPYLFGISFCEHKKKILYFQSASQSFPVCYVIIIFLFPISMKSCTLTYLSLCCYCERYCFQFPSFCHDFHFKYIYELAQEGVNISFRLLLRIILNILSPVKFGNEINAFNQFHINFYALTILMLVINTYQKIYGLIVWMFSE